MVGRLTRCTSTDADGSYADSLFRIAVVVSCYKHESVFVCCDGQPNYPSGKECQLVLRVDWIGSQQKDTLFGTSFDTVSDDDWLNIL